VADGGNLTLPFGHLELVLPQSRAVAQNRVLQKKTKEEYLNENIA